MDQESYLAALCRAVPYHIVQQVLKDPTEAALAYRNEPGSVLFADLVSFTSMCERIAQGGPERLGRLSHVLNELFTGFELEAFFPFGGYIVEFGGDAMLVVFLGEGHALRCAAAALKCQEVVSQVAAGVLGEESRDLRLRVGVAAGTVRLSVLGDLTRRLTACSGAAAHQAIGLQQRAAPGEILADQATATALDDVAELHRLPGRGVRLSGIRAWPARESVVPLGARMREHTREKIELLEPFVPAPLARRLRAMPGGWRIEAEIRRPVILFADVLGFPEDPRNLALATSLSRSLLRSFQKHDGLVLKVVTLEEGHRVMVLFGLHHPTENDGDKAVLAAQEAMTRMRGYGQAPGQQISMRVGVHTGPVFFGAIGGEHKHDLTAIGDAVNVTARTASLAGPGEIVVTDAVMRELSDAFTHSIRGPIKVKGREEPLPLHVIHGMGEGHAHYGRLRRNARFTAGREDEQTRVRRAVEAALDGRGRLLGLRGEAGTGKSHLLSDLVDQWVTRGGVAVVTRCRYATRAVPLAPVRELFSAVIGSTDQDDEQARSSRLRRYLSGLDLGMDVKELVSILQPTRRPDGFDEAMIDLADLHSRDRLVAALVRVLDRRVTATDSRLLYVVEDLHHADSITLQLAQRLSVLPRDRAFLVVGTWRPGPGTERMDEACDEVISLGPLDVEATAELVRHEMRAQGVEPSLADFFWRRTAGNPEHLVQTVRFLADRLLLAVRGGTVVTPAAWRDRLEDLVPPAWEHVALARLDGLNELERRVLRTASAIGPHFGAELVLEAAAASLDKEQVSDALGALESHRILSPDAAHAQGWRFRDEATRAIAYQIIPPDERLLVHRRIADCLERGAENRMEVAAAVAHHRERAGQVREALGWYGMVARSAFRAGLEVEAHHFAEKWAQLHDQLTPGDPAREKNAPWLGIIRAYLTGVGGKPKQALEQAFEVLRAHRRRVDATGLELLRFTVARCREALGQLGRARGLLLRTRRSGIQAVAFESTLALGQIAEMRGLHSEARRWIGEAELQAGDNAPRGLRIDLLRGWAELSGGANERARVLFETARQQALRLEHQRLRAAASSGAGFCALLDRRFAEAHHDFDEALRIARGLANLREEGGAEVRKAAVLLFEGRFDEALAGLERAAPVVEEGSHRRLVLELGVLRGAAMTLCRDVEEGARLFRRALAEADADGLWVPSLLARLLEPLVAQAAGQQVDAGWRAPESLRHYALVLDARPEPGDHRDGSR